MAMDTECDATVEAQGNAEVMKKIRELRDSLIAEHTGREPAELAKAIEETGSMRAAIGPARPGERHLGELEAKEVPESVLSLAAAVGDIEKPMPLDSLVRAFTPDTSGKRAPPGTKVVIVLSAIAIALALLWRFTPLSSVLTLQTAVEFAQQLRNHPLAPMIVILAYTPPAS
jgi:hypothetical protein